MWVQIWTCSRLSNTGYKAHPSRLLNLTEPLSTPLSGGNLTVVSTLLWERVYAILLYGSITQCWGQREAPKQRSTFYKPPKHHTTKPKTWDINHQRKKFQTCQNTCIRVRVTSAGFHGNRVSLLQTSAVFGNSVHGPEAHLLDHSGGDKSYKDGFDFGEPPNAVQQEIKWKHSWLFVRNMAVFIKHRH